MGSISVFESYYRKFRYLISDQKWILHALNLGCLNQLLDMHLLIFFFSNHKFDENNEVVQKDKDRKDKKAKKKKKKDKKKNKGKVTF